MSSSNSNLNTAELKIIGHKHLDDDPLSANSHLSTLAISLAIITITTIQVPSTKESSILITDHHHRGRLTVTRPDQDDHHLIEHLKTLS
jgi:hypothetical protein